MTFKAAADEYVMKLERVKPFESHHRLLLYESLSCR